MVTMSTSLQMLTAILFIEFPTRVSLGMFVWLLSRFLSEDNEGQSWRGLMDGHNAQLVCLTSDANLFKIGILTQTNSNSVFTRLIAGYLMVICFFSKGDS